MEPSNCFCCSDSYGSTIRGSYPTAQSLERRRRTLHLNLDDAPQIAANSKSQEILAIDEALDQLAKIDARKAKVIELRLFGGLSVEETEVLAISPQSVMRDWKMARTWLLAELRG